MPIEDAIKQMTDKIKAACAIAEVKAVKMSDEEARDNEGGAGVTIAKFAK